VKPAKTDAGKRRIAKARMVSASRQFGFGDYRLALDLCDEILQQDQLYLSARVLKLRILFHGWTCRLAVSQLQDLAQSDGAEPSIVLKLGAIKLALEDYEGALPWLNRAFRMQPTDEKTVRLFAKCLLRLERHEEAISVLTSALESTELPPDFWDEIGLANLACGRIKDAKDSFSRAISLEPNSVRYLSHFVDALVTDNDDDAIPFLERLLTLEPKSVLGYRLLAVAKLQNGLDIEAEDICRKGCELDPLDGRTLAQLASICLVRAKTEEAMTLCQESINLEPCQGLAYFERLRTLKTTEKDRPFVEHLAKLSQDPKLTLGDRELLGFGLGKTFEDLGEYERSFAFYTTANADSYRRKFGSQSVDRNAFTASRSRLMMADYLTEVGDGLESSGTVPVFVLGMMRSGTTLTEQILSCHPEVGAAGEQRFWNRNASRAFRDGEPVIDESALRNLGIEYCQVLRNIHQDKRYIVDKMPGNYFQIGLIRQALPGAKIIHVRREPADTCLSIFTTHNNARIPWIHSQANIALNYQLYLDVMDHWRTILPRESFIEVWYEDLVSHPETEIRRMVSYCGLDWFEGCLAPEQNKRAVMTPSLNQVRQPIHKGSVERWRRFEPWITEFLELNEKVHRDSGLAKVLTQ